jgi:signal transduction histidine kinase
MSRERTPAGNILALARSREDQAKEVEESATSYMPTDIDLETLMPDEALEANAEGREPQARRQPAKTRNPGPLPPQAIVTDAERKRKRISLYLDDDVLTKIFRVSLERHEQLSSATHRLILEALKARGL